MKNNLKVMIVVLALIVIGIFIYYYKIKPTPINEEVPTVTEDSIKGCYVARIAQDVYTLTILSQNDESFEGKLSFKNFEKDSSSGTYNGTYKDGILLGDYSFQSEGMFSVMQVIFKKVGSDFIRGFGTVNAEGNRFIDLNNINYEPSAIFKFSKEECTISSF